MSDTMKSLMEIVTAEDEEIQDAAEFLPEPSLPTNRPAVQIVDLGPQAVQELSRKVKIAFLSAKSPEQVFVEAQAMSFATWLDTFIKLSPKELQVKGQFDVRSLMAQMGPIQRAPAEDD